MKTFSINNITDVVVKLNVESVPQFGFVLGLMVKFYLYLLGAVVTAAILQLEKIRII